MDFFSKANESLQQPAIIQEISGNANLENIKEILNDDPSQINAIDSREGMEGYTALHYACWDAKTDIAKYLIEKGASLEILNEPCEEHTHGTTDFFENCRQAGPKYFPDTHDEDRINEVEKYFKENSVG